MDLPFADAPALSSTPGPRPPPSAPRPPLPAAPELPAPPAPAVTIRPAWDTREEDSRILRWQQPVLPVLHAGGAAQPLGRRQLRAVFRSKTWPDSCA